MSFSCFYCDFRATKGKNIVNLYQSLYFSFIINTDLSPVCVCVCSPGAGGRGEAGGLMLTGVPTWRTHVLLLLTEQTWGADKQKVSLWNKHYVRSVAMTLSHLCRWGRTDRCSCPLRPHRWRRSRSRGPGSRPRSPRRTYRGNQTHRHSCRHRIRHIFTKIYCKISHDGASLLAKAFLCHNPLVLFYANL